MAVSAGIDVENARTIPGSGRRVATARVRQKRRPPLGRPATIVLNIAATLGILCVLFAAAAMITGMRVIIFSTGSMAPTVPAGSLAVTVPVAAPDIAAGDVISAHRAGDGALVTHRVVRVDHRENLWLVTMRGDANTAADSTPYDVTGGAQRLVFSVPAAGRLIAQVRSPWIIVAVPALLVLIAIPTRRRAHRHRSAGGPARASAGLSRGDRAAGEPARDPDGR
jgi:signal peptidase